jgi:hypothetical protein
VSGRARRLWCCCLVSDDEVTAKEVEFVAGDLVDVLGPEAPKMVERVPHKLGTLRTSAQLLDRCERHHPVSLSELQ